MATKSGGGGGGSSAYNSDVCTLESGSSSATGVDPYIEVEYTSGSATGQTVTTTTTITGAQEKKLSLRRDTVGIHTVQCKISHPTAVNNPASVANSPGSTRDNSPLWTDKVEFNALSAVNLTRSNLTYEITQDNARSTFSTETVNLFVQPLALTGWSASNNSYRNIHLFAEEEDLTVKMTMSGSAGQSFNGNVGGQGGTSIFTYTLQRNTEYTLKLGVTIEPTASIGRGGAGAYFYEGGRLLVCCGGGGASGWYNEDHADPSVIGPTPGGRGAGAGIAGENSPQHGGGNGGFKVNTGELPAEGRTNWITGNDPSRDILQGQPGGRVESCTTGQYWKDQGIAPCAFMGVGKFRLFNGLVNENTNGNIKRGYKADYDRFGYRHNGGNSRVQINGVFIGGGGAGAYGGTSCSDLRGGFTGGGGGSGYSNGSVNMLHSQLGGNPNSQAQCLIELLTSDNDKVVNRIVGA